MRHFTLLDDNVTVKEQTSAFYTIGDQKKR